MDLIIFDLDGTLIDSKLDLAHSVNATRAHLGLGPLEHERIYSYVGNGAPMLLRRSVEPDAPDADLEQALEFFVNYYHEHRLDHTRLYPEVRETLDQLSRDGKKMAVLTNKPVRISRAIVDELGLGSLFFQVYGGNSFGQKKPHPQGIQVLLAESGLTEKNALMVGDSGVDIQTARNAGIASCGVTFGFQPESLVDNPPDYLISRMLQLLEVVQGRWPLHATADNKTGATKVS